MRGREKKRHDVMRVFCINFTVKLKKRYTKIETCPWNTALTRNINKINVCVCYNILFCVIWIWLPNISKYCKLLMRKKNQIKTKSANVIIVLLFHKIRRHFICSFHVAVLVETKFHLNFIWFFVLLMAHIWIGCISSVIPIHVFNTIYIFIRNLVFNGKCLMALLSDNASRTHYPIHVKQITNLLVFVLMIYNGPTFIIEKPDAWIYTQSQSYRTFIIDEVFFLVIFKPSWTKR